MSLMRKLGLMAGVGLAATAASAQPAGQKVTGPIAVYWMSAATQSGFGIPGMGGGRPSPAQMMAMMNGGGGAQHTLTLQLGSSEKPSGAPNAEHLPPDGLGAGPSLPLVTPEPPQGTPRPEEPERPAIPPEYQKPKGRMLIFWGCGEHARLGQPMVIDFAQVGAGKMPPGMEMLGKGLDMRPHAAAVRPPLLPPLASGPTPGPHHRAGAGLAGGRPRHPRGL